MICYRDLFAFRKNDGSQHLPHRDRRGSDVVRVSALLRSRLDQGGARSKAARGLW